MKKNTKIIVLFCTLILTTNIYSVENNQIEAMKWVKHTIEKDINNVIKPTIFKAFTQSELEIAKDVIVTVPLDPRFSRVIAYNSYGLKKIEISTGFLSLISSLIDANIIAEEFNKVSYLLTYKKLMAQFITSKQDKVIETFKNHAKIPSQQYNHFVRSKEYNYTFSLNLRIVLSYILAHEYAHHIFGHLTTKKPKNLLESRYNEDIADDFAIRINSKLKNNPLPITDYFILFSLVENGLQKDTHSPSACRLEKFLNAGINYTKEEVKNLKISMNDESKRQLQTIQKVQKFFYDECLKGNSLTSTTIPQLWE